MSKLARRILFILATLLFATLSLVAIVVALGYKYDFHSRTFVKTGSIQINANTDGEIYLDGTYEDNLSFFHNYSQGQILPGYHNLEIRRDGYNTWSKKVLVNEGELVSYLDVYLLPSRLDIQLLATLSFASISSVSYSDSLNLLTIWSETGSSTFDYADFKWLTEVERYQTDQNIFRSIPERKTYPPFPIGSVISHDDSKLAWRDDLGIWVGWLKNKRRQPFKAEGAREIIDPNADDVQQILWFEDNEHLIIKDVNRVYMIEIDTRGRVNKYEILNFAPNLPIHYDNDQGCLIFVGEQGIVKIAI